MLERLTCCLFVTLLALAPSPSPAPPSPAGLEEAQRIEIERTLGELEAQWIGVYSSHDLGVLHRLIADDFVATLSDGAMRGKTEHIAAYAADFGIWSEVANSEVKVYAYGADVGVVTGLYTARLRDPKGPVSTERYRYTDTWVRRAGVWQCVATQETRLP